MQAVLGEATPRRKAVLLIVILILSMLVLNQFTGLITNMIKMDINIASSTQASIYIFNVSDKVTENEQASFYFALDNIGSNLLEGNIYVEIRDSGNDTVDSFNSSSYSLQPGSYITYIAQWYAAQPPGNYTLLVWDNYTSPTDMDSKNFSIECIAGQYRCFGDEKRVCNAISWNLVAACKHGCYAGACLSGPGGRGVSAGVVPSYSMEIEYDETFRVVQGMNYTYTIRVMNNGSAALTNISMEAWSDYIGVRIPEIRVIVLQPGESATFVIDLEVPAISLGDYEVNWQVSTMEIARTGSFVVGIASEELTYPELCTDAIDRYFEILDSLGKDIRSAEIRGYNMDEPKELLREATDELEVMKTLRKNKLHEGCNNRVDILRKKIEQTAMVYSIAISRPVSIIAYPWIEYLILIFTIIALVVVVVIIIGWRKAKDWLNKNRLYLPKKW